MDFTQEIGRFITGANGGIYIVNTRTNAIVFADALVERHYGPDLAGREAAAALPWEARVPGLNLARDRAVEWEYFDGARGISWRLSHGLFDKAGVAYRIGHLVDTTEFMLLNREVAEFSALFKRLAAFQSAMLARISSTGSALLPVIADYFGAPRVHLLHTGRDGLEVATWDRAAVAGKHTRRPLAASHEAVLAGPAPAEFGAADLPADLREGLRAFDAAAETSLLRLCAGNLSGRRYAVLLEPGNEPHGAAQDPGAVAAIVALCVENSLLREAIVYDSEHDKLTGLYNKGKYLARLAAEYPGLDSVGLFNFDVNNLKTTNDRLGHEAGDRLLVKAAASIRRVVSDTVHGYRLGGDEYLMVACNCTEAEVAELRARWERALADLNRADDDVPCVIAAGTAFARKPYDFAALMRIADERMYADKRRRKAAAGAVPAPPAG